MFQKHTSLLLLWFIFAKYEQDLITCILFMEQKKMQESLKFIWQNMYNLINLLAL